MNVSKAIIGFVFTFILFIIILYTINSSQNYRIIDKLSNKIAISESRNTELLETNTRLSESVRIATERIGNLEKEIIDRDRSNQARIDEIKTGLGKISSGIIKSGDSLQGIIDGLEQIKIFINSLE